MTKLRLLAISVAAGFAGGLYFGSATAQIPTPTTYLDLPVPALTGWSDINTRTVVDEDDPEEGETFIYADQAAKNLDPEGDGDGARAVILWELDDGSGRPPGIQAVTDDFNFPTQNCIMASGERESDLFEGVVIPKTCSDDPGSSKRFFMEIFEPDVPVDLVFDTGVKTLRYKGVKSNDGGVAYEAFREEYGIGRIYRVIQKAINLTDPPVRVAGIKVELGFGVGGDFRAAKFSEDGVAFEVRPFVDREFFVGETGADDRRVWNEDRFATLSPKFYDDGSRERFKPGYFDVKPAGMFPPQGLQTSPPPDILGGEKSQFIDSGKDVSPLGKVGAITDNYFDIPGNQGSNADPPIRGTVFGYWLPEDLAVTVIGRHSDGDPETEADTPVAWWDGEQWRYGVADNFAVVERDQLTQWAVVPIGLDPSLTPNPARYEAALSDDLSALNMDTYIYLGDQLLDYDPIDPDKGYPESGTPKESSITLRLTLVSAASGLVGAADPEWTLPGKEAPPLSTYMPATGVPVAINDFATTTAPDEVLIDILANDLLDGQLIPDLDDADVKVTLGQPENGTARLESDNRVTYTPDASFDGKDAFTYSVTVDGEESNIATVAVTVRPEPVVAPPRPVAGNVSARAIETEPVTINVLENVTLNDAPILPEQVERVVVKDQPLLGTVTVQPDNTIVYQANEKPLFDRIDRFTYSVIPAVGVESNTALVTVQVLSLQEVTEPPVANPDFATTTGTNPVTINVLANDTFLGEPVPAAEATVRVSPASNGSAAVNADGTITYTAQPGFDGDATFTYRVTVADLTSEPATVTVTVLAAPLAAEPPGNGGSSGCSVGNAQSKDPILPMLALLSLVYLVRRRLVKGS